MNRRSFLGSLFAGAAAARRAGGAPPCADPPVTLACVRGPLDIRRMGTTLVHEHVLVDFAGAAVASRSRYDAEEVFRLVLPRLREVKARGCRTFVECTPAYLGRDPRLLRRLSEATGLDILTNTGYYGAAKDVAVPAHAYQEPARRLADRWTAEWRDGIEGTGIRPGFVKSGVDAGPLSEIDRKLIEAAALCHLDTGLTLAIHTGDEQAALGILLLLGTSRVSPEAWIWVHAQNASHAARLRAAEQGAWIELDGVSPETLDAHVEGVLDMSRGGRLAQVLVSQDAGWYHVGEPGGGRYRPHTFLFDTFVPALRAAGLGEGQLRQLLVENPARAFTPRVRPARA